jgi:hypothetical protein
VLAHAGEALDSRKAFEALPDYDKDSLIEFLKSLQVLPPGTKDLVVDENYKPKVWAGTRQAAARQASTPSLAKSPPMPR